MATISIKQRQLHPRDAATAIIKADLYGVFAVHRTPMWSGVSDFYTLTHVPSGFAFISAVSKETAEACARDLNVGDVDWSIIAKPSDMTAAHKAQGKAMREKYER